jgi:CheY-like chemotaxis protein
MSLRILLVDDHADTLRVYARILEKAGYVTQPAETIAAALARAAAEPFDLVISDIHLSDSDGCTLMRQLRDRHSLRGIAITGSGIGVDEQVCREAGFGAYLVKPVNVPDLMAAIANLVGGGS